MREGKTNESMIIIMVLAFNLLNFFSSYLHSLKKIRCEDDVLTIAVGISLHDPVYHTSTGCPIKKYEHGYGLMSSCINFCFPEPTTHEQMLKSRF